MNDSEIVTLTRRNLNSFPVGLADKRVGVTYVSKWWIAILSFFSLGYLNRIRAKGVLSSLLGCQFT